MKQGMAEVNGARLYYEVKGKGFPVVFISGGGTLDRRAWDDQFETFAKAYEVIRYDIRGIGKSERPREAFSHSRDLYALLRFLEVKRAHIISLSFAGAIAIDFALEHPEMVDHLVLAATGTSGDSKSEANLQSIATLTDLVKREGLAPLIEAITNSDFMISKENSAARAKVRQIYLDNGDVFENGFPLVRLWQPAAGAAGRLSEIRARVLVILPENDHPAYKAMTEGLASGITGANIVVIPGGTHLVNLERPKEFNQAVMDFLSK